MEVQPQPQQPQHALPDADQPQRKPPKRTYGRQNNPAPPQAPSEALVASAAQQLPSASASSLPSLPPSSLSDRLSNTADHTAYTTDVSPNQTSPPKRRLQRTHSTASTASSSSSPRLRSPNAYRLPEIGVARRIMDESDHDSSHGGHTDDDPDDDEAAIAKVRNALASKPSTKRPAARDPLLSDPSTSSLSSTPSSSAQPQSPRSPRNPRSGSSGSTANTRRDPRVGTAHDSSSQSSQMPVRARRRRPIELSSGSQSWDEEAASDGDDAEAAADRTIRQADPSSDAATIRRPGGSGGEDDDDDEALISRAASIVRRRGAKVSAMKGKDGKATTEPASTDDEDVDTLRLRKNRTFKIASSSSIDEGGADGPQATASSHGKRRRERMEALAAAKRRGTGGDASAPDDDGALGGGSLGVRSRSASLEDDVEQDSDADARLRRASTSRSAAAPSKELGLAEEVRHLQTELADDAAAAGPAAARSRTRSKSAKPKKASKLTGPKPLSKREQENMFRETARIQRDHRARLAPVEKKQITLSDLLTKINNGDQNRQNRAGSLGPAPPLQREGLHADDQGGGGGGEDEARSNHISDPIESDPIRDRSSPASSPIVGLAVAASSTRQRRLGPPVHRPQGLEALGLKTASQARAVMLEPVPEEAAKSGDGDSDDDDVALPDAQQFMSNLAARNDEKARLRALLEKKTRMLEAMRASAANGSAQGGGGQGGNDNDDDDDGFEIEFGEAAAGPSGTGADTKRSSDGRIVPATPGRKRPSDTILHQVGIRTTRTPGRKGTMGTDAFGSPGMALGSSPSGAHRSYYGDENDNDHRNADDLVTDSQLRAGGKAFAAASDKAAGKTPVRTADARRRPGASASPALTHQQLNATLMRKAQTQNIQVRQRKLAQARKLGHPGDVDADDADAGNGEEGAQGLQAMLDRLEKAKHEADKDDDDDPNLLLPAAEDAEDAIGSGSEIGGDQPLGSGSEVEDDDDDENNNNNDGSGDVTDGQEDSEKENAPPPAGSARIGAEASPALSQRALQPSRAVMDEDEDEAPGPRAPSRRRRKAAIDPDEDEIGRSGRAVDDDDDDDGTEVRLQPGRITAAGSPSSQRSKLAAHSPARSQGERTVLGDISAESLGRFSQPGRSVVAGRRDSLAQDLQGDESYRTDDISLGGFTQLFASTQAPGAGAAASASGARSPPSSSKMPSDPWQPTQTRTQTQPSQSQSQAIYAGRPFGGSGAAAHPSLARDDSVNSALGAFFEDTQSQMASESMDIFANPKNKGGMAKGFTQFFGATPTAEASQANQGGGGGGGFTQFFGATPAPGCDSKGDGLQAQPVLPGSSAAGAGDSQSQSQSQWDADRFSMPPPRSTAGIDGFAALRKAQMGEAMNLAPTPSLLPSLDESQAEREAAAAYDDDGGAAEAASPKKMYVNRAGFFTQTKPSTQQAAEWGLDSQTQTQTQFDHTPLKIGPASLVPETPLSPSAVRTGEAGGSRSSSSSDAECGDGPLSPSQKPRHLKRLRRGAGNGADEPAGPGSAHGSDDETNADEGDVPDEEDADADDGDVAGAVRAPPLGQGAPRNAFDVLRSGGGGGVERAGSVPGTKSKRKRSEFVQGEAEESSDEELGRDRRGDRSGLGRVFSDDDARGSGCDQGSEDENEDDDQPLEGLVDDERDADEAAKDVLARQAFQQDLARQDEAALAYHQRAVRGEFRQRRQGRDGRGLEGFLDEDADEEELRRRAAVPRSGVYQKRRLDGERDEMDELREDREARAFVEAYEGAHRPGEVGEYGFLAPPEEEEEEEEEVRGNDDEVEELEEEEATRMLDDDEGGVTTHAAIRREVRERRRGMKRRRRGGWVFSDDDGGEGEDGEGGGSEAAQKAKRQKGFEDAGYGSDKEDEKRVARALHDRVQEALARPPTQGATATATARRTLGTTSRVTYAKARRHEPRAPAGTKTQAKEANSSDAELDDETSATAWDLLLEARRGTQGSAVSIATQVEAAGGTNDAEPEWSNDLSLYRMAANKATATRSGTGSGGHRGGEIAKRAEWARGKRKGEERKSEAANGRERERENGSLLSDKVLKRGERFSETM
ncbi:hypothetical protein ACQY0O_002083 [Thecaphora frezii]